MNRLVIITLFHAISLSGVCENAFQDYQENAFCSTSDGNWPQVIAELSHNESLNDPYSLLLLAHAYENIGDIEKANEMYQSCLNAEEPRIYEEALTNLARLHFIQKNDVLSLQYIELLLKEEDHRDSFPKISKDNLLMAKIFRAKIHLRHQEFHEAKSLLLSLQKDLPNDHVLLFEVYYLLGEMAMQQGADTIAACYFEKAIPHQNQKKASWFAQTLYYLGSCYLKIATESDALPEKMRNFELAEQIFEQLLEIRKEDADLLTYTELLLDKSKRLNDSKYLQKIEQLLCEHQFSTEENSTRALILRAQAATAFAIRQAFFQKAIELSAEDSQWHIYAWYQKGINDLSSGALENAIVAFQRIITLSKEKSFVLPAVAKQIHAHLLLQNEEGNKEAISLLGYFLKNSKSLTYQDSAYYLLASIYYIQEAFEKAEQLFLHVAEHFPNSRLASHALFYASHSASQQGKSESSVKAPLEKIIHQYPHSPLAAESYMRYYSQGYGLGPENSLKHLEKFNEHYPDSPFAIYAYYVIGLEKKKDPKNQSHQTIKFFKLAEEKFSELDSKGLIPIDRRSYFQLICYQARVEKAWSYYDMALHSTEARKQIFFEYAKDTFTQVYSASSDSFWEECLFGLSQCHIQTDKDAEAESIIDIMLEKYLSATITRGFYLSRAWYDKGCIAMRKAKYQIALDYFAQSEDAAKGKTLSVDQKLDLWIQKSLCFRFLGQLDISMRLLSKVINENVVSSMRLKAMYLRAELYEIQNKRELAQRQLESLAKKGGEWADKAKEKIHNEYHFSSICLGVQ